MEQQRADSSPDDWPRFSAAPRELEPADELISMASDGHRQRIWTWASGFVGMQVGGMVGVTLQLWQWAAGVPAVALAGVLLGAAAGARISRTLAGKPLREGIQVRGEVTKVKGGGSKAEIAYSYEVASRVSSHNMWCRDPAVIANTKVGTPILVLYDPERIDRHLAYLPAQFERLRELLPGKLGRDASVGGRAVNAEADAARIPLELGRGVLPPPPRPLPVETARAIRLGMTPRQTMIALAMFFVTLIVYTLLFNNVIEPTMWVAVLFFATVGTFLTFTLSSPFTGRWLLCNGVEAAGKIERVWPPNKGIVRVDYSFEAAGRRHRNGLRESDAERASKLHTGDPVLVLYAQGAPWFSTGFVEAEARALIEECKRRT